MKIMRLLFSASVLASVLSISAFAGNMHTGIAPEPDPTPETTQGVISTPVAGDISTPSSQEAAAGDSVVTAVLGLVESVLSLL
jgi:hypothetical protein